MCYNRREREHYVNGFIKRNGQKTVTWYAGGGPNLQIFPIWNEEQQVYGVVAVDTPHREQAAGVLVLARIVGDTVIIEEDTTNRPLFEALIKRGIPREQIILHYVGEPLPELLHL